MRLLRRLLELPPQLYTVLAVWLLALIWLLVTVLGMETPVALAEDVLINGESGATTAFPGLSYSNWFGVPMLGYQMFAGNVMTLMIIHLSLWAVAALLAVYIISKWRGKTKFQDAIIPLLFLNPSTVQTLNDQWMTTVFWVVYLLVLVALSRGYLRAWKLVVAMLVIALGTWTPAGIAVTVAAFIYYAVHWIKTKWYTSAFLSIWLLIVSVTFFLTTSWSGYAPPRGFADGYLGSIALFNWLEMFYGRWGRGFLLQPFFYLFLVLLSVVLTYWLVHPWIRSRKRVSRERELLLILGSLLFLYSGGVIMPYWNSCLGGYTAMFLFALYWSSQIQRRWPKQTPRWVFAFLVLVLVGSYVEYLYLLDANTTIEMMARLGVEPFTLG